MTANTDPERAVGPGELNATGMTPGRRRLLRGGLGAAPILMTLASGPVSAGMTTTASAFASMQPSGKQGHTQCSGRSPPSWSSTCNSPYDWPISSATKFNSLFTPRLTGTNVTLKMVIDPSGGYNIVARTCVAALLNASTSPPLTPTSILSAAEAKSIWTSYATKGYYAPTPGIQWNAAQIVDWITTTYA